MQIQNENFSAMSFKARLFNPKGVQVKNPNLINQFVDTDIMAKKGSKATDIFVNSIKSVKSGIDYEHVADVTIANPLFKVQSFFESLGNRFICPYDEQEDELKCLELLTSTGSKDCELLENRALYQEISRIVDERRDILNLGSSVTPKDWSPKKVLSELLEKTPSEQHGFSEKRINDFKMIAEQMEESLDAYNKFQDCEWCV